MTLMVPIRTPQTFLFKGLQHSYPSPQFRHCRVPVSGRSARPRSYEDAFRVGALRIEEILSLTFRALCALRWLSDNPQSDSLPDDVCPTSDAFTVYEELSGLGYIDRTATMDGSFDFILTSAGSVPARNARESHRAEMLARRVLQWISSYNSTQGLVESSLGEDFTGALTPLEIRHTAEELEELGMLTGSKQANGEFFYVETTSVGRRALRDPYLILASPIDRTSVTNISKISSDNYGTMTVGNQVLGGQGHTNIATVNITAGMTLNEALEALRVLREDMAGAVVDADQEDLDDVLDDIDGILRKGAKRGMDWLRSTLAVASTQIATVAGQEFADRALAIGGITG
ncbi:hypothetical protein [Rhodococcus sp. (in: high G+C Gram-positive bacteria)]|uniref:hypothetical protein n=1 Tax=Rhodococcus sp. TaxID=1831 RepID=UPI0033147438